MDETALTKAQPSPVRSIEVPGESARRLPPILHGKATPDTVLDQQGIPRPKIQAGLGHKKAETTDGYFQSEFAGRDAASHAMPL